MIRSSASTRNQPPAFWEFWLTHLGCSARLVRELWEAFGQLYPDRMPLVRFALDRMTVPAPEVICEQRAKHFGTVVSPQDVLRASARLSPDGERRRRDVVQFENALLTCMDRHGRWK